ncbi:hypothetical protein, partial [Pseudomonas sp. Sample_22]|uniref:hypothetical protein n=1 Tax=Pseudomonas sp. Sample_22 TaxID=2448266 RepID=UPI0019D64B0B
MSQVLALRASILTPSPVPGCALCLPPAFGLRTVLQDGLPAHPRSPGGSSSSFGSGRPKGLSVAV